MQVYVINLAARADRRASVTSQLDKLGVGYKFFEAIEGPGALETYFDGRNDWPCHMEIERPGQPNEVACHASHLCLWRTCVEINEPIVILEDDFAASNIFTQAIEFTERHIDRYGFIRLEPMEDRWRLDEATKPLPVLREDHFTLYFQTAVSLRTTGYAISPAAAQRFIEVSRQFTVPVDHVFRRQWVHRLPLFAIDPPAIGLTELADDPSIVGRKKSPARHFLRQAKMAYRAWAKYATTQVNREIMSKQPQLFRTSLTSSNE